MLDRTHLFRRRCGNFNPERGTCSLSGTSCDSGVCPIVKDLKKKAQFVKRVLKGGKT